MLWNERRILYFYPSALASFLCGGSYSGECLFSESRLGNTWKCIREVNVLHPRTGAARTSVALGVPWRPVGDWPREEDALVTLEPWWPRQDHVCRAQRRQRPPAPRFAHLQTEAPGGPAAARWVRQVNELCVLWAPGHLIPERVCGGREGSAWGISGCKMLGNLPCLNSENSPTSDA